MKLVINKFCGIDHKEIELQKINVFKENNGYGKTSIINALRFCLSGDFGKNPIYENGNICQVDLYTNNGITLSRTLSKTATGYAASPYINKKKCSQKDFNAFLKANNMASSEIYEILCNPMSLSEMTQEQLSDFILNVINKTVTLDKLSELANGFSAVQTQWINYVLKEKDIEFDSISLKNIDDIYSEVYALRAATKKDFKNFGTFTVPAKPKKTIEKLNKEMEELISLENKLAAAKKEIELYKRNSKKKEDTITKINELTKQINSINIENINIDELNKKITDNNAAIIELEKRISSCNALYNSNIKIIKQLEGSKCPISDKITCTADKTDLKHSLEKENEKHMNTISECEKKKAELVSLKSVLNKESEKANENNIKLNNQNNLIKTIEMLKASIPEVGEPPLIPEDKDFSTEKEALRRELKEISDYETLLDRYNKKKLCENKIEVLNDLCALFSPKGIIKINFISLIISPIEEKINDLLQQIKDIDVKLNINKGIEITCKTKGDTYINYDSLSGGEKIIVTFAIYNMLNQLYGNKYLVLDDLDRVDTPTLETLFKTLKLIEDNYDFIIVAMVKK